MFRRARTWPAEISAKQYDYIVAGGGTAGIIIATRLSEDPNVSVLVLEAGGEPTDVSSIAIPVMQGEAQLNPAVDWMVRTTPQADACGGFNDRVSHWPRGKLNPAVDWMVRTTPQADACGGLNDRVSHWPRGKVLGGSSCLNSMLYVRGNKENFDEWRDQFGCDGWGYDDVLPYFKKAEKNTIPGLDAGYHGTDGPMTISENPDAHSVSYAFVKACEEFGLENGDYNGAKQNNVARMMQHNVTLNGTRDHVAQCYLKEARSRPNLTVVKYAHVTRVVLDSNNHARGVAYKLIPKDEMTKEEFNALPEYMSTSNREVIVCGGAVHSPHILMLSGLGPKEHLEEHGIRCLVDLPMVGQNLQDHLFTWLCYNAKEELTLSNQNKLRLVANLANYYARGRGVLRSTVVEAMSFHSTSVRPDLAARDVPDLQVHFSPSAIPEPQGIDGVQDHFNIKKEHADTFNYKDKDYSDDAFTFLPTLLHPKSIGEVRLKSSSAFDNPLVDPHYLEHPDDMRVMVEGVKLCERLVAETSAFKGIVSTRRPYHMNPHTPGTDEYYERHVRDYTCTVYHPVGTVAMGKWQSFEYYERHVRDYTCTIYHPVATVAMGKDPKLSALTPDLKVRGVTGLRVADCSVMPTITSGNTHAPAIMIGEKCADLIKEAWLSTPNAKL